MADVLVDYTTTQSILTTPLVAGPADANFNDAFRADYKRGIDADVILGYDFGMFRLEGELGYKRAGLKDFGVNNAFIASLNSALNRPSGVGDPGAPGLAALSNANFDLNSSVKVYSAMVNGLVDFGNQDGSVVLRRWRRGPCTRQVCRRPRQRLGVPGALPAFVMRSTVTSISA